MAKKAAAMKNISTPKPFSPSVVVVSETNTETPSQPAATEIATEKMNAAMMDPPLSRM